ncbi:hypothetical protein AB0395_02540 [Streptosporangium sp. NPDC051023]|uniref:hypothetical protein n=1 Tax=Streptosporangium sp. NPDC051023 TaxID=3155410 RepID=UPI0034507858
MADMDDLDERFAALTSQIEREERRRMSKAAAKEWSRLPRNRRRRKWWIASFTVFALVAVAGLVVTYRPEALTSARDALSARPPGVPGAGDGLPGGPVPEETTPVEASPVPEETTPVGVEPVPVSPFAGSPAEDYADGAKGLVTPEAKATGGLSRGDVAAALKRTRDMLVASHLDHRTLMGGRPTALARLLIPEQREWFLRNLDNRKPKKGDFNTRHWVTSLAPKTAELTTDVIKVNGRTKYAAFRENGRTGARITVKYLFVYAIRRPGHPEHTERVIVRSLGEVLAYRENGELVLWPVRWNAGSVTGVRCDIDDGFAHPVYDDSVPDKELAKATGAPIDPYQLDRESREEDCTIASRT